MNRIIITEGQLYNLICEAATLDDIYVKYYSDIDRGIFNKIVSSDPTWREDKPDKMGKFGKWLLKLWVNRKLMLEDLYKATEYLSYFVKYNNRIEVKDINKYHSLPELYNIVKVFMDNPEIATSNSDEVRRIKEGADKVFENGEWLVIVPHTKEASCYYGKGTQWCTAAEQSNNMFDHYNSQGNLYINIRKSDGEKFQFHFESDSFMDATDTPIESPIYDTIGFGYSILDYYKENLSSDNFNKLVETKIEVNSNDNGEILMYCTTPYINYYYLYDESYDTLVADRLKRVDPDYITNSLHLNRYVVIENLYGYYTLVTLNSEGCHEKISDNLISVDKVDKLFGTSFDDTDNNYMYLVDKEGIMEIYNSDVGYVFYKHNVSDIIDKGSMYNDVLWFKKKNGLYDIVDVNYDNSLYNLRPIDESEPLKFDENGEYLYMINGQDELWKIDLLDGLTYYEIDNIEEEY
jgi:hypothetical protein